VRGPQPRAGASLQVRQVSGQPVAGGDRLVALPQEFIALADGLVALAQIGVPFGRQHGLPHARLLQLAFEILAIAHGPQASVGSAADAPRYVLSSHHQCSSWSTARQRMS
jgi:hypothetical protein